MKEKSTETKKKVISYSQFSNWYKCPHRWYLDHPMGLRIYEDSIQMIFGDVIHRTLQLYLKILYTRGTEVSEKIDKDRYFKCMFKHMLKKKKLEHTPEQLVEYITDGENILSEFSRTTNRMKHFPAEKYELVDIEHKVLVDILNNVKMIGYLDLVLKEKRTGKIKIVDIKTSVSGWNAYMKEDESKTAQLLMYKALYSKQYNIPLSMIDVEFFIIKRKLYEGVNYPQSRIQVFVPRNDKPSIMKTVELFTTFVTESFTPDGQYNMERKYPKVPGKYKKNCKWCPHKKVNCDTFADPIED